MRYWSELKPELIEKYFTCPICGSELAVTGDGKSIQCRASRHSWDISASGYVNFAGSGGGDSKEAVKARRRFLSLGHYRPVADTVAALLNTYANGGVTVDAGCGEGSYGRVIAEKGREVIGFDLSRPAVEAAAKLKTANTVFAVAGINAMPIRSASVSAVTNIFAPCFENEFARVLKSDGIIVLVSAGPRHLWGLKTLLYDRVDENTPRADLPTELTLIDEQRLSYEFTLTSGEQIADLFSMTPYCYRTSREAIEKLNSADSLTTPAEFDFHIYKKV